MADKAPDLRLFATIPPPSGPDRCAEAVRGAATRAAAVGFSGTLVHSDNNTVDPWVVAREALSVAQEFPGGPESPYRMGPFLNHATYRSHLVGSHEKVAGEIRGHLDAGCGTSVLDAACKDDCAMNSAVFDRALSR